jgi:ribosomal protein S18 acetylase RimI-like enzyme
VDSLSVRIRDAEPRDAEVVAALIVELAAGSGERSPVTPAYAEAYLASPTSKALVAEAGGQVVGLLTYSVRPDLYHAAPTGLIEELVVTKSMRGRGVGSALVDELFCRLTALGCAEVSVTTLPDNATAIEFYKARGLTDEAVLLEKHLES